jgi:myo-inositol-1(or 4)-monophosphatase
MLPELTELSAVVCELAREELVPRFARVEREIKRDRSVVTVADTAMQERLEGELADRWPQYRLLGEETDGHEQRRLMSAPGAGLWIVDPLDGTSNFAAGIPFFSVSVALMLDGEVVLGVVYDPAQDECFTAAKGAGAFLNQQPLAVAGSGLPLRQAIAGVDFKRLPARLAERLVREPPYSSQRSFGSVALDWCWVAADRFHVYLHGKQKLWDYAAGQLVLDEAGGFSCTLDGESAPRPSTEPRSAVAALHHDLFGQWCRWLGVGE